MGMADCSPSILTGEMIYIRDGDTIEARATTGQLCNRLPAARTVGSTCSVSPIIPPAWSRSPMTR
jgi:hypothetical protein